MKKIFLILGLASSILSFSQGDTLNLKEFQIFDGSGPTTQ